MEGLRRSTATPTYEPEPKKSMVPGTFFGHSVFIRGPITAYIDYDFYQHGGRCLTVRFDNHLPSVFAAAVLRPHPLQKPESCEVKQRPHPRLRWFIAPIDGRAMSNATNSGQAKRQSHRNSVQALLRQRTMQSVRLQRRDVSLESIPAVTMF